MDIMIDRRATLVTLAASVTPGAGVTLPGGAAAATRPRTIRALFASGYANKGATGLLPIDYMSATGALRARAPVPAAADVSFAVRHDRLGLHYLVQERAKGMVAVYDATGGRWTERLQVPAGGAGPCHLALDRTGTALAVAHYGGGSIALFRLDPRSGLPLAAPVVHRHAGTGPNAARQEAPHAHWVGFSRDNRWLHAVDLGADAIFACRFDAASGQVAEPIVAFRTAPGAGPRHMAHHPALPFTYLANELGNSLTVLRAHDDGRFTPVSTATTLPAGFAGKSQVGAIEIDGAGRTVYVSNRGHDSIAVFAIGADGGATLRQIVPSGGQWPRHLRLLENERRLLAANQNDGRIASFAVAKDGRLTPHGPGLAAPGVAFIGTVD